MDDQEKVKVLQREFGWWYPIAVAAVKANGKCEYCGEDLLDSRAGYSSMETDHLLPRTKYSEYAENEMNWGLACRSCNSMKRDYDPLEGEVLAAEQMLREQRLELIYRVKKYLHDRVSAREKEWYRVKHIIRGS